MSIGSLFFDTRAKRYNEDQPRDDDGKWTDSGGGGASAGGKSGSEKATSKKVGKHPGTGYSPGARVIDGVIHTSNVYDATRALCEGRKVELSQPREVSTLLTHLVEVTNRMVKLGEKAPLFDLCKVSVAGTNLFCAETKGIPRVKMPQLDRQQNKDFRKYLKDKGFKIEKTTELASHMRATQNQLDGVKVANNVAKFEADPDKKQKRIILSRDNYILDGHHHWAAQIDIDARNNRLGDIKMKVARVDISITELLRQADKFTGGKGKKSAGDRSLFFVPDFFSRDAESGKTQDHDPATGQFAGDGGGASAGIDPEETPKSELNPSVIAVGGDQWNKDTAVRLEREYVASKGALEAIATDAVGKETAVENEPDPDDAPVVPEEWDMLSVDQQEEALAKYKSQTYDSYLESEVENWSSEYAPDEAKVKVAEDFTSGDESDWAADAVAKYIEDRAEEGLPRIPYSADRLVEALEVKYDHDNIGSWPKRGVDITFDADKLGKPDTYVEGQMTLPGIPEQEDGLAIEQTIALTDVLDKAFDKESDKVLDKLSPPDYLGESVAEYQADSWDSMDDSDKFSWVKQHTQMVDEAQEEYDKYMGGDTSAGGEEIDKLPAHFDPLETQGSAADYKRTQKLARHMSIERAAQLIVERSKPADLDIDIIRDDVARIDRGLWESWKGSSTSYEGILLQKAAAAELGGRLNEHEKFEKFDAEEYANTTTKYKAIGGWSGVKAYVRAKWETTQYLLDKANVHVVEVYRGIRMRDPRRTTEYVITKHDSQGNELANFSAFSEKDAKEYIDIAKAAGETVDMKVLPPEPPLTVQDVKTKIGSSTYQKLPDIEIRRNGCASTTTDRNVANGWDGKERVVLRAEVPRTAVLSVPAYGINVHSEHEVVVAGTAWVGWDAWRGQAPDSNSVPMTHHGVAA